MTKATLATVRAFAATLGAKVEDDKAGNTHECRCEAPHGKVWAADGIHEFVDAAHKPWKPDYDDLLARMKYGVEDCPEGLACEWCHPTEGAQ